eukprot:CAMPEP_0176090904 /NCGR_PEP_ID=MMETSP0120_2-20121206/45527_1 /TAXON_ID=160619 /ORGANISM="Kryptoperidinium foliaceum, Strain CCMP 1326" /LENGTH=273 /DNA_ID=CAMNT_0017424787 /DNA_START=32 /DNA_END=853 /DNA_ORIENTATION=-
MITSTRVEGILFSLVLVVLAMVAQLQKWFAPAEMEHLQIDMVRRIPTTKLMSALTIDGVPFMREPSVLESLLDVMKANDVKATLFVMSGFRMSEEMGGMDAASQQRCMDLLRRAVDEGHELGNQTQFAEPLTDTTFERSLEHCDALLAELCGASWKARPHRWHRPAAAPYTASMQNISMKKKYTTVGTDFSPLYAMRCFAHVYLVRRARPGAILIVQDRWHSPATLAKALPEIASMGIKLTTLSEVQAAADAERLANWKTFGHASMAGRFDQY